MNVTTAILQSRDRRDLNPNFNEKVAVMTCLLRAKQVLPYRRAAQNAHVHHDLAGAIALAHELNTTLDVSTKSAMTYHADGVSSMIPAYLQRCLEEGILEVALEESTQLCKLQVTNFTSSFLTPNSF